MARYAADWDNARAELGEDGGGVGVRADNDRARFEDATRRRADAVEPFGVSGGRDGCHRGIRLEIDVTPGHGEFEQSRHKLIWVELAGREGECAEGASDTGDAFGEGRVVDVVNVLDVDRATGLQLSERCFGILGRFGVEEDVGGARQVEVAVDAFLLDQRLYGVDLAGFVAGDGCCGFGAEKLGVFRQVVVRVGLDVAAISTCGPGAEFPRFEQCY